MFFLKDEIPWSDYVERMKRVLKEDPLKPPKRTYWGNPGKLRGK